MRKLRSGHDQRGLGVELLEFKGDIGDTGSRILSRRFAQDIGYRQLGQLFVYDLGILLGGDDIDVLYGDEAGEPRVR